MKYENSYWYPENKEHYEHIVSILENEGFRKSKYMVDWATGDAISTGSSFFHTNNISRIDTDRTNDDEFRLTAVKRPVSEEIVSKYNVGDKVVFSTKVPNPEYHGSIGVIKDVNGAYATVQIYNEKLDSIDWYTVKELDEYLVKENVEKELDNTSKPDVSLDTAETKEEAPITVEDVLAKREKWVTNDSSLSSLVAGERIHTDMLDSFIMGNTNPVLTRTGRITSKKTLKELI